MVERLRTLTVEPASLMLIGWGYGRAPPDLISRALSDLSLMVEPAYASSPYGRAPPDLISRACLRTLKVQFT